MSNRKGAFAGFIIGLLLVPGSIALHAWNEYRTIHRTHGLNEAQRDVVSVESERVESDKDGKLVHLAGNADTNEELTDKEFGIRENSIHLRRTVEMYQWVEDEHDNDGKKSYSYDMEWEEGRVNSDKFSQRAGHENPIPKFKSQSSSAKQVTIGAYRLNNALRDQMQNWQPLSFGESSLAEVRPEDSEQFKVFENIYYWSQESPQPDSPKLGDLRISFDHVVPDEASLVAKQKGETFETYRTSNGEPIERLYDGILSAEDVFVNLKTENTVMAWLLRGLGLVLCVVGVLLLFSPIQKLFSWIPFVGDITGSFFFVAALLIGSAISFTTISVSWIAVRPLLGLGLLAAAIVSFFLLSMIGRKAKPQTEGVTVVTDDMLVK